MLKIKKISEVLGKRVFTDAGDFFGEIEEVNLQENKIDGWRIKVASSAGSMLGGARGVIVPHQFVKAIGDVVVISVQTAEPRKGVKKKAVQNTIFVLIQPSPGFRCFIYIRPLLTIYLHKWSSY